MNSNTEPAGAAFYGHAGAIGDMEDDNHQLVQQMVHLHQLIISTGLMGDGVAEIVLRPPDGSVFTIRCLMKENIIKITPVMYPPASPVSRDMA
jgi:hypothetical protein